jgi:hypothetical protein
MKLLNKVVTFPEDRLKNSLSRIRELITQTKIPTMTAAIGANRDGMYGDEGRTGRFVGIPAGGF